MLLIARGAEPLLEAVVECRQSAADGAAAEELVLDVTEPDAGERIVAACEERFGKLDVLVNNAGTARWRDLDEVPEDDWYARLGAQRDGSAARDAGRDPGMARARLGAGRQRLLVGGQAALGADARVLGREGRASSRSRACSPTAYAADGVLVNAVCPGPTQSELWMERGRPARPVARALGRPRAARRRWRRRPRSGRSARLAEVEEIAAAIVFLCSERASYVAGRGLVGRRRHGSGDHLDPWSSAVDSLRSALLRPRAGRGDGRPRPHRRGRAGGAVRLSGATRAWCSPSAARTCAATRGEISFPGGRRDHPTEDLLDTALREAEEEIGLAPASVEVVGALPPIGTFVTNYKVHPFVGLIGEDLRFEPNPAEVETVLAFRLDQLREGFAMRRLVRRGVPIRTPTYVVGEHLIWGATARILGELIERLPR